MTTSRPALSAQDGSLLLYCLGVRPADGASLPPSRTTMDDWAEVLRQAGDNNLLPLLYHRLRTVVPTPEVPPGAMDHLREAAFRSAARSLRFSRDLAEVLDAFRRDGIPVVVLKGGHLGQVVYESFALRTMCDLDLMVRRDDLVRAAGLLGEMGYVSQYYGVEEVDYEHHHHIRPMARPDGIRIELHWNIVRPTPELEVDLDGIWERARVVMLAGVEARVLCPEDLLLHLCLHASYSHKFRVGLRACWDIGEVIRHYGDQVRWDDVVRRAREWRIGKYTYLTLRLAREVLGAAVPAAAETALEPPGCPPDVVMWARVSIFAPEHGTSVSPSMARLWTSRRLRAKVRVMFHTLYPSRTAMARIYRTPPGSSSVYLYYLVRWADLLRRYGYHAWELWRGNDRTHDELQILTQREALRDWLGGRPTAVAVGGKILGADPGGA